MTARKTSGTFKIDLGRGAQLDARTLVDTRMLIAGSSGSGKSYTMRVLAEQVAPKIQTIILDPEGEYTTLREKHDMVIVGEDGELAPTVPTAAKLARRLLELQVSAVIDLYALKLGDRRAFVRHFLDSMMSSPKSLWRPCFLMLDEAHRFCPERGSGQSESTDSVITLLSQGRKRGYCGILATQRLQKLHKDAAAETLNNLIGRTSLDTDVKRARDILGLSKGEESKLRGLKPGNWYGFGPAFVDVDGICKFVGSRATTTHPQAGQRHRIQAPGPSARIRKVIVELSEIPAQIKQEADTEVALRSQVRDLKRELKGARKGQTPADPEQLKAVVRKALQQQHKAYGVVFRKIRRDVGNVDKAMTTASDALEKARGDVSTVLTHAMEDVVAALFQDDASASLSQPPAADTPPSQPPPARHAPQESTSGFGSGGMFRIVQALVCAGPSTRLDTAIISRLSPNASTLGTYLGRLRKSGHVAIADGGLLEATDIGIAAVGSAAPVATSGDELITAWGPLVGGGGQRRIFDALAQAGSGGLTRPELSDATGLSTTASTLGTYIGRLKRKGIVIGESGKFRLPEIFFR